MRQHRRKILGVGVAALAVLAGVLAFAAGGRAASGNICLINSGTPPTTPASCVTEVVAPPFISTAGDSAVSFTKFQNQAGIGGATATHVQLNVIFPATANVDSEAVWVAKPGSSSYSQLTTASCSTTTNSNGQTVESCSAGNIAGGGKAKMIVQFDGSSSGQLTGEVTYGEGGGGPSNPPNDDQIDFGPKSTLFVGSDPNGAVGAGGCPTSGGTITSGSLGGQITSITAGTTNDPTLTCTYLDAGVKPSSESAGNPATQLSFVDFPTLSGNGFATVTITFPSSYKVTNKTLVDEDTNFAIPYFSTFITLANCDRKGNIVVNPPTTQVGTPTQGETNTTVPRFYDACIFDRLPSTNQVVLHVLSNPLDQTVRGH